MSATEVLRRLLDERGVEWSDGGYGNTATVWEANGILWRGLWRDGAIELVATMTPEQAIEATLGRGECRNKARRPQTFWCDQCDCATESCVDVGGTLINGFRYCPWCGRAVRA